MSIQLTVMSLDFDSSAAPFTQVFSKEEITLGRLPGNDLVLDKPEVSGYHASLRVKHDNESLQLFIKDLGSSNGTMVENSSLRAQVEVAVEPNQRIIIGNYLIKPTIIAESEKPESIDIDTAETNRVAAVAFEPKIAEAPASMPFFEKQAQERQGTQVSFEAAKKQVNGGSIVFRAPESSEAETSAPEPAAKPSLVATASFTSPVATPAEESPLDAAEEFTITVSVGDADIEDLDFIALQLLSLEGRILHKGSPLAGVQVKDATLGAVETDAAGYFSYPDSVEGTKYSLQFEKAGYLLPSVISGTLSGSSQPIEISARKLRSIRGRIVHNAKALAGVTVDGGPELGTTITDAEGYYCFTGVPEDAEYTLRIRKEKFVIAGK